MFGKIFTILAEVVFILFFVACVIGFAVAKSGYFFVIAPVCVMMIACTIDGIREDLRS